MIMQPPDLEASIRRAQNFLGSDVVVDPRTALPNLMQGLWILSYRGGDGEELDGGGVVVTPDEVYEIDSSPTHLEYVGVVWPEEEEEVRIVAAAYGEPPAIVAAFREELHPRGLDGRFIDVMLKIGSKWLSIVDNKTGATTYVPKSNPTLMKDYLRGQIPAARVKVGRKETQILNADNPAITDMWVRNDQVDILRALDRDGHFDVDDAPATEAEASLRDMGYVRNERGTWKNPDGRYIEKRPNDLYVFHPQGRGTSAKDLDDALAKVLEEEVRQARKAEEPTPPPVQPATPDSGVYGNDTKVSLAISGILNKWVQLQGQANLTPEERAKLAAAVQTDGEHSPVLWRGISASGDQIPDEGDVLHMDAASFSNEEGAALAYAESDPDAIPVMFEVAGAKALNVSSRAEQREGYAEAEWIAGGDFTVSSVEEEDGVFWVSLRPKPPAAPPKPHVTPEVFREALDLPRSSDQADAVQDEFFRRANEALAGTGVQLESKLGVGSSARMLRIAGGFVDEETGLPLGTLERIILGDPITGGITVQNEWFTLSEGAQGRGVASKLAPALEDWYREMGVSDIRLLANMDVGGYTWATQGFGWDLGLDGEEPEDLLEQMVEEFRDKIHVHLQQIEVYTRPRDWEHGLGRPPEGREEAIAEIAELRAAFETDDYESWPAPYDLAMVGYSRNADSWPGKSGMLGRKWQGVKHLEPAAPPPDPEEHDWHAYQPDDDLALEALADYRAQGYDDLSGVFRFGGGTAKQKAQARAIVKEMKPAQIPFTAYRGIRNTDWIEGGLVVGNVIEDKGFQSVSRDQGFAERFTGADGAVLRIKTPVGQKILLGDPREKELIFEPSTRLRVTGITERPGQPDLVDVEVIPA